jgi:hypothetical protein
MRWMTLHQERDQIVPTVQGKDLVSEVIVEVFSVTKFTKNVKKTSAKTSVFGSGCFCGDYNKTSL